MGIRYKVISDDTDFGFYIELRPWYAKWLDFKEAILEAIFSLRYGIRIQHGKSGK